MDQALILDRYRPLADLGSGGHASVTLAYDTKMGRRVAIKRLPLPLDAVRPRAPRRPRRGAHRRDARPPVIVTVFEWDTDEDEAFLIMEHVEGVSLAEVARRGSGGSTSTRRPPCSSPSPTRSPSRTTTACCTSTSSRRTCSSRARAA